MDDGLGDILVSPLEATEDYVEVEDDDEVQPAQILPDPGQPTAAEIECHRCEGHVTYRSWCKWCVQGRGRGLQHKAGGGSSIPRIGPEYFFITSGGLKTKPELVAENDASGEGVKIFPVTRQLNIREPLAKSPNALFSVTRSQRLSWPTSPHAKGLTKTCTPQT